MAQVFTSIFMVLYYVIFIQIIIKLMGSLVKGFVTPKFRGDVKVEEGDCIDHVVIDADVSGFTDHGYYAIINWGNEGLVTSDNDVIAPSNVVVKPFKGSIHHEFDIYPECYPACHETTYKFTVELGWCSDEKCSERHKVISKNAAIKCGEVVGGGGRYFTPRTY